MTTSTNPLFYLVLHASKTNTPVKLLERATFEDVARLLSASRLGQVDDDRYLKTLKLLKGPFFRQHQVVVRYEKPAVQLPTATMLSFRQSASRHGPTLDEQEQKKTRDRLTREKAALEPPRPTAPEIPVYGLSMSTITKYADLLREDGCWSKLA